MSSSPEQENGTNAFLCYVVLGDAGKSKRCSTKITSLPLNQVVKEEGNSTSEINNCKGVRDVMTSLKRSNYFVVSMMNR